MDLYDGICLPATQQMAGKTLLAGKPGQVVDATQREAVGDVEDGVAVVEARQRLIFAEPFGGAVRSGGSVVPTGT
jgi:hypothetical protein